MAKKVSEPALMKRINTRLAAQGERLCTNRSQHSDLGRFFRVDLASGDVVAHHLDAEQLGREMGVLASWEQVVADPSDRMESVDLEKMARHWQARARAAAKKWAASRTPQN